MYSNVNALQRGKWCISLYKQNHCVSVYTCLLEVIFSRGILGSVWQKQYGRVTSIQGVLDEFNRTQEIPPVCKTDWHLVFVQVLTLKEGKFAISKLCMCIVTASQELIAIRITLKGFASVSQALPRRLTAIHTPCAQVTLS